MLSYSVPPGYAAAQAAKAGLRRFTGIVDRDPGGEDRTTLSTRKQRHTAKRIFDRLRDEYGFTGGYTIQTV